MRMYLFAEQQEYETFAAVDEAFACTASLSPRRYFQKRR